MITRHSTKNHLALLLYCVKCIAVLCGKQFLKIASCTATAGWFHTLLQKECFTPKLSFVAQRKLSLVQSQKETELTTWKVSVTVFLNLG